MDATFDHQGHVTKPHAVFYVGYYIKKVFSKKLMNIDHLQLLTENAFKQINTFVILLRTDVKLEQNSQKYGKYLFTFLLYVIFRIFGVNVNW